MVAVVTYQPWWIKPESSEESEETMKTSQTWKGRCYHISWQCPKEIKHGCLAPC
jgi:hypothetical protein